MDNENKNKKEDNQINTQKQQEYTKTSKLGLIEGPGVNQDYFNYILKKYNVNRERFLKDILREQKILLDNKGLDVYHISTFLNTLRKFYKKQDIEEVLKITELNEQESDQQQKPFEDLNDFLKCYCKQIKNQIRYFKPIGLANTLNGLAHLDITKEDLSVVLGGDDKLQSELLEPICKRIKDILLGKVRDRKGIVNFNSVNLANTLNGLVTIFLYNKEISKETKEIVSDCVKNILAKAKEIDKSKIDDKTKYTFKKNLFYLKNVLNLDLFLSNNDGKSNSLEEILKEKNIQSDDLHIESSLEIKVGDFLKGRDVKKEVPISCTDDHINYSHPVDFKFNHKGKTIYCEVDGPTHFVNSDQTEDNKTPQTKIRDQINEFIVSKTGGTYVTIPANKCENKEQFFGYIDEKLGLGKTKEELTKSIIESRVAAWEKISPYKPKSSFVQLTEEQKQSNNPGDKLPGH